VGFQKVLSKGPSMVTCASCLANPQAYISFASRRTLLLFFSTALMRNVRPPRSTPILNIQYLTHCLGILITLALGAHPTLRTSFSSSSCNSNNSNNSPFRTKTTRFSSSSSSNDNSNNSNNSPFRTKTTRFSSSSSNDHSNNSNYQVSLTHPHLHFHSHPCFFIL
jgi:hypothetical protein